MKNYALLLLLSGALFACSNPAGEADKKFANNDPDACDCVEIYKSADAELKKKCDDLREGDEAFDLQFKKCLGASIIGRKPEEVTFVSEGETILELPENGLFEVVPDRSTITWIGKKVGKIHRGDIRVKSGLITFENSQLTGGEVIIDMTTLTNRDLKNEEERTKLENHLRSDDFFGVDTHPEARFVLTRAEFQEATATLYGDLTIKGITHEATLTNVIFGRSGKHDVVTGGILVFDRSKFDVRYGSDQFFDNLGDALINNEVTINFKLRGRKPQV